MTVGEKIQFYRKKIGLSQEELGKKMLVSRQTVSLWELDKTLPTVDNFLRLREIFSVSIDEILSETEPAEENGEKPKEAYAFKYEESDLRALYKKTSSHIIKNAVISTIPCILPFVFLAYVDANDTLIGLLGALLGCCVVSIVSHIKGYFSCKKAFSANNILKSTYSYEVFNEYFVLNIIRNNELARMLKVHFDDIEKIQSFGNYFTLQISGQIYIIKKDALLPNSKFIDYLNGMPKKAEPKKPSGVLKTVSSLLFWLSVATVFGALTCVAILSGINKVMTENMWVFFLFLPVPISSVVFGFYLKKKGCKYKKNVVVGFVIAALLCIYGSFSFAFADLYSHSDEPIIQAEKILNIDIPPHTHINTQDWSKDPQYVSRGYIYFTSDIYFEDTAVKDFEKALPNDTKWISDIPSNMVGISSYFCDIETNDYYIIYNKDTKEFNSLPGKSGTYVFINVLYNAERNTMKLVEYRIKYTQ